MFLLSFFNCLLFSSYEYFRNTAKVIHSKEHTGSSLASKDWRSKVGLKGRFTKYHKDYRTRRSRTRKIRLFASRFNFRPTIPWKLNPLY